MYARLSSTVNSNNSNYKNNTADEYGGVVMIWYNSVLNSTSDHFENNQAGSDVGVVYSEYGYISVIKANAPTNAAEIDGGVFRLLQGTFEISEGNFSSSSAKRGAVISADRRTIKIYHFLTALQKQVVYCIYIGALCLVQILNL